jgi:hypothetical protein
MTHTLTQREKDRGGLAVLPGQLGLALVLSLMLGGCQSGPASFGVSNTVPSSVRAPWTISRIVVLYPEAASREVRDSYSRLDAEVFKLKAERPSLRIVDRRHLPSIIREQEFQLRGMVSEDTAIRVGRVLGVDSVLVYHIEGPTLRDVVFARFSGDVPPIVITSKVIMVESAEVVYHNVVSTAIEPATEPLHTQVRAALQRAIARTASDLRQAFR